MDPMIARLTASFCQTMTLGRRKKKVVKSTTNAEEDDDVMNGGHLSDGEVQKRGRGFAEVAHPMEVGGNVVTEKKSLDDDVRILDHVWSGPYQLHFDIRDGPGRKDRGWHKSEAAIIQWPKVVLDFYLSKLVFGANSYQRSNNNNDEEEDVEREELVVIGRLLKSGMRFREEGRRPMGVNGLIRYKPNREVLVFVEFFPRVKDSVIMGEGREEEEEEALLPLQVCVEEIPHLLLEFLHAAITLTEDADFE